MIVTTTILAFLGIAAILWVYFDLSIELNYETGEYLLFYNGKGKRKFIKII